MDKQATAQMDKEAATMAAARIGRVALRGRPEKSDGMN